MAIMGDMLGLGVRELFVVELMLNVIGLARFIYTIIPGRQHRNNRQLSTTCINGPDNVLWRRLYRP